MGAEANPATCVFEQLGGARRKFELTIDAARDLEIARNATLGTIFKRLRTIDFSPDDVIEIVYQGLVGAGTSEPTAMALRKHHLEKPPFARWLDLADRIADAALNGLRDQPSKKADAEAPVTSDAPATSANSSKSAARSGSRRGKSAR